MIPMDGFENFWSPSVAFLFRFGSLLLLKNRSNSWGKHIWGQQFAFKVGEGLTKLVTAPEGNN